MQKVILLLDDINRMILSNNFEKSDINITSSWSITNVLLSKIQNNIFLLFSKFDEKVKLKLKKTLHKWFSEQNWVTKNENPKYKFLSKINKLAKL